MKLASIFPSAVGFIKKKSVCTIFFPNRPWCTEKNGRILADTAVVIESDAG